MTKPPFPLGMKAIVAQTAVTGLVCLFVAVSIAVHHHPPTTGIDESAGLAALGTVVGLLFLAAAGGLALRFGWVRWLWLAIEAVFVLPWSIVFTCVSFLSLRNGDPVVGPWLSLLFLTLSLLWLAGCVVGAGYMTFGRGRHAFERPAASPSRGYGCHS